MKYLVRHALVALVTSAMLAACSGGNGSADSAQEVDQESSLAGLEIKTAKATAATDIPVATVPGQINLPPQARVAVTAPFPGAAVKIYVIEGQAVRRGQSLALVRAVEPLRIRGDLARARAEADVAIARAKRLEQLAREGVIAGARADEARAQARQAQANLTQARGLATLAGSGPDGTITLRAPIGGRVSHVGIETGGAVDTMTAPFVIENTGAYQIDLQLPERLARRVKPGMPIQARVNTDGSGAIAVSGEVISVAPSIDPATRSIMAKASIGAAPGVVAGRNVSVNISDTASGNVSGVTVPASALVRLDDKDTVFVKGVKGFLPRAVKLAARTGDTVVIEKGLQAGEEVATSSTAELKAMAAK
ncbi:efflux RND transporter periplasmic adaptor subunit [Porphyrobacter algicida]|uniref:Efflux RND transporter periplasmic adaptor subunit n=2 Tax=Qipengyuania algicida TaxID=1836209 RepID=A0A845AT47_9SPHN|nr:efflux RND transporter periplasmic adaptor subunit [Qipengyuania algicida]